ncbi:MAG: hypothetical protein R3B41_00505 [Candidatus Doudnabacteria bacterium]
MAKNFDTILEWRAPEFKYYQKNAAWFITLSLITGLIMAYMFIVHDIFGAISMLILAIFIWLFALHKPNTIQIVISDIGIHINQTIYPYEKIKHFWVLNTPQHQALNFETTAYLNHIQTIEINQEDPELIRDVLLELLPEHAEVAPTTAQHISHYFRF